MSNMTRADAYWILHEMMVETFSADQSEALHIALNDIQSVDLMPNDTVAVVRCKDCVHWLNEDGLDDHVCLKIYSDGAVSSYAWQYRDPDDFCSYGKRRDEDV